MKILWFTWKDLSHPQAGGAEVVNEQLAKRLVRDGHAVTLIVGGYKDCQGQETHPDGYKIIRLGNRYSLYWLAFRYYRKHLKGWADLVIDEVNTIPFFTKFYVKEPSILFVHMLCREIWFHQLPQPLSTIGYYLEPLYIRILNKQKVITVSESTKQDLLKLGYKTNNISIISEGIELGALPILPPVSAKAKKPTMLSLGAMRTMKRTLHQIQAFEHAKARLPELQLHIAGDSSGAYGSRVMTAITQSKFHKDITYHGKVSKEKKFELLQASHCLAVTSVKEGWGLVVTEANGHGTPAVVYNVDGLRDSVKANATGLITRQNTPEQLANDIADLLTNPKTYNSLRRRGYEWSKTITFDNSYRQFLETIA